MTDSVDATGEPPRPLIDRQHPAIYRAQVDVARAVRAAVADAGLDRILVELINIRVSQINGCAYCLHVHVRDAMAAGETAHRIAVLPAWRDTSLFTDIEYAALGLAESLTRLPDARTQELDFRDAARRLTPQQLSAVSWVAITMNAFNRVSIVSQHRVKPEPNP